MYLKRARVLSGAVFHIFRVTLTASPGWFGHLRYGGRILHRDDHRDITRHAIDTAVRWRKVRRHSDLVENRRQIERSSGMLDLAETEIGGRVPGKLQWEYSHLYDPLAGRGLDEERFVNAKREFVDFWERALVHFRIENTSKAYRFLGYCCHLLQDMAVPAHTYCVAHGPRNRIADNLELLSSSRRFRPSYPIDPPYPEEPGFHLGLFEAMAVESRGRGAAGGENEIAQVLNRYYEEPLWTKGGWVGRYIGDCYHPVSKLLPSSPRIRLLDLVTLRNYLLERAVSRTAQLIVHFSEVTGCGEAT